MPDELPADPPDVAGTDPGSRPSGCAEPERRSGHEGREHERGGAPAAPTPVPAGAPGDRVTRSVVVGADVADVWHAVADPGERALWLDDPDAAARRVRIEESSPEHRLVWTWWRPGDEDGASTVSVVLSPADGGGTRVVVTETLPTVTPLRAHGGASARAGLRSWAGATRRAPAWLPCAADRWDGRLLGLELRVVAARVGVA